MLILAKLITRRSQVQILPPPPNVSPGQGRFPTGSRLFPLAGSGPLSTICQHSCRRQRRLRLSTCGAAHPARPASPQVQSTSAKPDGARRVANPTRLAYPAFRGTFNRRSGSRLWDACSAWLYDVALQPEPHSGRSLGARRLSLARGCGGVVRRQSCPEGHPEQVGVPCPRISCCCGAGKRATG